MDYRLGLSGNSSTALGSSDLMGTVDQATVKPSDFFLGLLCFSIFILLFLLFSVHLCLISFLLFPFTIVSESTCACVPNIL